jgi:hypothetical protein
VNCFRIRVNLFVVCLTVIEHGMRGIFVFICDLFNGYIAWNERDICFYS